jgi:ribosomal protein S18 acetylase RimI-like enzyme
MTNSSQRSAIGYQSTGEMLKADGSAGVAAVRDELVAVYRAAFAPPLHHVSDEDAARFGGEILPRHAGRAGFRCRVAREAPGGPVVGFAYGYTSAPGQWWHDLVARALGADLAERWLGGAFEFVELAVAPAAQGRGLGGRLHDALLAGLPHRTAVLSTRDAETPAVRLYRGRGWTPLLTGYRFPGGGDHWLVLGRVLS